MKVYLMRHGETDYNKKGLIQGTLDIPLNEFGLELAEKTKEGFEKEGLTFDYCYCSPLIRARQTAEILTFPKSYPGRVQVIFTTDLYSIGETLLLKGKIKFFAKLQIFATFLALFAVL